MNLVKHWAAQLDDYVIDLAWSPNGAILAAASAAGPVTLFSGADGAIRHELPGHDGGTNAIAWAPAAGFILASGGQDGSVKFWDGAGGQHTATAKLGPAWVEHLAWASDGRALAAATGRKLVLLRSDGSISHAFPDSPKTISALAWQPASTLPPSPSTPALAAAHFGGINLWNPDNPAAAKILPYGNGILALAWSPDGKWLVSGNQDPSVHLWVPAEEIELQMSGYEGKVKHLSFDHTSRWLATSGGRDACLWDCSGAGPEGRAPGMLPHDGPVCAAAFQPGHGLLATAAEDGALQLWSPERKQPLRATARLPSPATKLSWSPDDQLLAIGSQQGIVYVLKCEL